MNWVFCPSNSDLGLEIREDVGERVDFAELLNDLLVFDGALLRVFPVLKGAIRTLEGVYLKKMKQNYNFEIKLCPEKLS